MRIPIVNTDAAGIIADLSPHDLPLPAWSAGRNVRIVDGRTEKITGHKQSFTPIIDPRFVLAYQHINGYYWIYASDNEIAGYNSGYNVKLTRDSGAYNAVGYPWSGGVLNGIPILNAESDIPQAWLESSITTKFVDLPNWPTNWRAKNLKPFGNFLVALGVSKGGGANPYNVNWSHPADPGTVPPTWDIADPTHDAGENTLAETSGFLVNQMTLGDVNLIYKEDSVYAMQYVGGAYIFAFRPLFKTLGLLCPKGLAAFSPPGQSVHHIVFSNDDVVIHDGRSVTPILEGRMRKWLYNKLDSDYFKNSFIINNLQMKEIWICFPSVGNQWCDTALIWNYSNNTMSIRDLPGVSCGTTGQIREVSSGQTQTSWDADTGSWQTDSSTWGSSAYQPVQSRMLMMAPGTAKTTKKSLVMDIGTQFESVDFHAYVERTGLTVTGQDRNGKPIEDSETVKLVREIWPRIEGDSGASIDIYVGVQDSRDSSTEWYGPYPFVIGVDRKVNTLVSGKIVSVRFESTDDAKWRLHGYDVDLVPAGGY